MTTTPLRAWHGDPAVQAKYVARMQAHIDADQVIQGTGFDSGRGCAVGCTLDAYDHSRYPIELGIPEDIARLEDSLFEALPRAEAPAFALAFLGAPRPGADLSGVTTQFLLRIQRRNLARMAGNDAPYAQQCRDAINGVIKMLEQGSAAARSAESAAAWSAAWSAESAAAWSAARSSESAEARSAESAWWAAAWSAVWSAASAAARSSESAWWAAAWSAWSAESAAAWSAAWSAESAAAWSAAWSAETRLQCDDLLDLMRSAPVGQ